MARHPLYNLRLPADLKLEFDKAAILLGKSTSALLRDATKLYLTQHVTEVAQKVGQRTVDALVVQLEPNKRVGSKVIAKMVQRPLPELERLAEADSTEFYHELNRCQIEALSERRGVMTA